LDVTAHSWANDDYGIAAYSQSGAVLRENPAACQLMYLNMEGDVIRNSHSQGMQ
jgi:hypothetical protein